MPGTAAPRQSSHAVVAHQFHNARIADFVRMKIRRLWQIRAVQIIQFGVPWAERERSVEPSPANIKVTRLHMELMELCSHAYVSHVCVARVQLPELRRSQIKATALRAAAPAPGVRPLEADPSRHGGSGLGGTGRAAQMPPPVILALLVKTALYLAVS